MHRPDDPHVELPRRMRVMGTSGSGKSRLAEQISRRLNVPRLELDAVFWDADWTYRDLADAHALITEFTADNPDGWVIDGNWTSRLDHSRLVVMGRVIRRTLRRGLLREELWHGNRERPTSWLRRDPEKNIMLWAWKQHPVTRDRMAARTTAGWPVIRLSEQLEVDAWLASLDA